MKTRKSVLSILISFMLVLSMVIPTIPMASAADTNTQASGGVVGIYGDVNLDGKVSIADVTFLQKCLAGYNGCALNDVQKILADVDQSGSVDIKDASIIQKYSIGIIKGVVGQDYTVEDPTTSTTETTTVEETTTSSEEETTSTVEETTTTEEETSTTVEETTSSSVEETTSSVEETTSSVEETTSSSEEETTSTTPVYDTRTIYVDVEAIQTDNCRYAAYCYNLVGGTDWFDLDLVSGNIYSFEMPVNFTNVIFTRMPVDAENDFDNAYNKTDDLDVQEDKDLFRFTGWGAGFGAPMEGEWDVYGEETSTSAEETTTSEEETTSSVEETTSSSEEETSTTAVETTRKIYFKNVNNWSNVRILAYYMDGETKVELPLENEIGNPMTLLGKTDDGKDEYYYDLPVEYTTVQFVSNSGKSRTVEITLTDEFDGYYSTQNNNGSADEPVKGYKHGAIETTATTAETTTQIVTDGKVITLKDGTNEKWLANAGAEFVVVDQATGESYKMQGGSGTWTVTLPYSVMDIKFNRNKPGTTTTWNSWETTIAGDTFTATGNNAGTWSGVVATTVEETTSSEETTTTVEEETTTTVEETTSSVEETTTTEEETTSTTPVYDTRTIYVDVQAIKTDNCRYAAYCYNLVGGTEWFDLSLVEGDVYSFEMPVNFTNVIFTRMPVDAENSFDNAYNKTDDLDVQEDKDLFRFTGWGAGFGAPMEGEWAVYGEETSTTVEETTTSEEETTSTEEETTTTVEETSTSVEETTSSEEETSTTVEETTSTVLDEKEYSIIGWINGADCGTSSDWESTGYAFVDGQVTVEFTETSYVCVKTTDNSKWFNAETFVGDATEATFYNGKDYGEKMMVPAGKVTFTLTVVDEDTVTVSYTVEQEETTSTVEETTSTEEETTSSVEETSSSVEESTTTEEETTSTVEETTSTVEETTSTTVEETTATEPSVPVETTRTVYFTNVNNWSNVRILAYYMDGETKVSMPTDNENGNAMTLLETNEYGQKVYCYDLSTKYTTVQFVSNSGASRTVEITLTDEFNGYYPTENNNGNAEEKVEGYNRVEEPNPTDPQPTTSTNPTDPTTPSEPTETKTITVVDATNEKWIGNADAVLVLVDNDTNTSYEMTKGDGVWTVEVPTTVTNVTINRNKPGTTTTWNKWENLTVDGTTLTISTNGTSWS